MHTACPLRTHFGRGLASAHAGYRAHNLFFFLLHISLHTLEERHLVLTGHPPWTDSDLQSIGDVDTE